MGGTHGNICIIIILLLVVDVICEIEINAKEPRGTKMWTHVIGRTASPRLTSRNVVCLWYSVTDGK